MNDRIIIAIDGFASCGKSTLAKALARELGYIYVDSGAMYRAVTLYFLDHQVDLNDQQAVAKALGEITITFRYENNQNTTYLNGQNVERDIREMRINEWVSPVSALPVVRRAMVSQQQAMGIARGIVMDGRDIGTVVFQDAELKIFLTASIEVRTSRRLAELRAKSMPVDGIEQVRENLLKRDHIDSTREDSPLRKAEDARLLDNSDLTPGEQLSIVLGWVAELLGEQS
jgi:cytidylate kinase